MAGQLSQSDRIAEFKTPLGKDVLVLINISGTEGLGELFEFQIDALSEQRTSISTRRLGRDARSSSRPIRERSASIMAS